MKKNWKKPNKTTNTSSLDTVNQVDYEFIWLFQFPIPFKFKFNKICPIHRPFWIKSFGVDLGALKFKCTIKVPGPTFPHISLGVFRFHGIMCIFQIFYKNVSTVAKGSFMDKQTVLHYHSNMALKTCFFWLRELIIRLLKKKSLVKM